MGQLLLFIVVALVVAAIVFGVTVMLGGGDPGLTSVEPDGRAVPLPSDRPLGEDDIGKTKFDIAFRGYRMAEVDQALQRAAYDIGYKGELIGVLEAEVTALREGRLADADVLRKAREAAIAPVEPAAAALPTSEEGLVVLPQPSAPQLAVQPPAAEQRAGGDDPLAEVGAVPPDAVPADAVPADEANPSEAVERR
jgi:DivIVA domain-containing protein